MGERMRAEYWQGWNNEIKKEVEKSKNLCMAIFSFEGELLFANEGMNKLFIDDPQESFINPTFASLLKIEGAEDLIYEGYITFGSKFSAKNNTIQAKVFRGANQMLVLGEVDANQLLYINEKLLGLNSEINDLQRKLIKEKTQLSQSELKVRGLLLEKEIILKEVHHRIKNNMNTINSLLRLQAGISKEPAAIAALLDAGSRVQSMLVLYDKIYRSVDFQDVLVKDYFSTLMDEILANFPKRGSVRLEKNIEDFKISAKVLFPLGIILNELLTNIMKYAFIGKEDGEIRVSVHKRNTLVTILIEDNGNGMPEAVDFENSTGFGLMLVGMLIKQIEGQIRIERGLGTRIIIDFEITTS